MVDKIDSNIVGLRYVKEASLNTAPLNSTLLPLQPNSYGEFGAQITNVARNPIVANRQRFKGLVTDLDATASFQTDFVHSSFYDLIQGFFFANWSPNTVLTPTAVTSSAFTVNNTAAQVKVGDLFLAEGFIVTQNNGLKRVTARTNSSITVAPVVGNETSPAGTLTHVGRQAATSDLSMTQIAGSPQRWGLLSAANIFANFPVQPGDWIWIGGDAVITRFDETSNNKWFRVLTVANNGLTFDRTPDTPVLDNGQGKTIQFFHGHRLNNQDSSTDIVRHTYTLERSLGGAGFEYITGAVANTLSINLTTADKITVDLGFVGTDAFVQDSVRFSGPRPDVPEEEAYNSSNDIGRLRMYDDSEGNVLFTYLTDLTLTINNNISPAKSIAKLGAFDLTAGDFVVQANVTAYFTTRDAVDAVRSNNSVSLDFAMVADNTGWLFDAPLMTLGDGRLNVEKDTEIKLPLTAEGARHPTFKWTLAAHHFDYLPDFAGV